MITRLRSLFNKVDRSLDVNAITEEERFSKAEDGDRRPKTAVQALGLMLPLVRRYDGKARLKLMVSQHGVHLDGASAHWEFFFDLASRQAQLAGEWVLDLDEEGDHYTLSHVDIIIRPFPPANSPLRQMVNEGHLLHRQLAGLWQQELQRSPDLPVHFRDTNMALADFIQQGLDPTLDEFSLTTGRSPDGRICWMAQTRDKTYYAALE